MTSKPIITIGIPAYNEAKNIGWLLRDLLSQDQSKYSLDQIIVVDDGSTDQTAGKIAAIDHPSIRIIEHKTRQGIARTANEIFENAEGEVLVFLNADVSIRDPKFIEKIAAPIIEGKADIVSSALEELPPKTFVEKILKAGMDCKKRIFTQHENGQNMYTCHGPMRAFEKRLYKQMILKRNIADDMYSYLYAVKNGFSYFSIPEAVAWYKLPDTLRDHIRQSVRFFKSPAAVEKELGKDFVSKHRRLPAGLVIKTTLQTLIQHPILLSMYILLAAATKFLSSFKTIENIEKEWGSALSSKKLR